ncbi:FAD-dependent monooxygenase [Nisaea sp.]|uniref:FAD-dependent monooxygenase n=1 Tax=Nisaea sp. TaxID=2024842 RepID=UPI003B52388E
MSAEVLIVGAGPVGMTAAIELLRRGVDVRLIDRSEQRTELSKAVGINVQTLELLQASGLTDRLLAAGLKIRAAHLHLDGTPLADLDLTQADHRYNFLLALPQSETERLLEARLGELGGRVERLTELTGLGQDANGVRVTLRLPGGGTETMRVRALLGADGGRSTVREALSIPFLGARYEEQWSLADISVDWPYGMDAVNLFLSRGGDVLFTVPIGPDRIRAISQTAHVLELLPSGSTVTGTHWESQFRVSLRQAERYQEGACYLAGDAAHVHSPAGGRGMNLGIWDACAFAERYSAGTLAGYSAERHPIGARILGITDRMFRITALEPGLAQSARNFVLRNIVPLKPVQRLIAPNLLGIER